MTNKIAVGDIALNVVDRGTGPPMLLVHGFPLDHSMWQQQIDELSAGCRVVAPDLRGFGHSDVTPGTVTMKQFADDLALLLDALAIDGPITLCGLSMGGYVAWQFCLRHASRLERLILCDTRAIADTDETAQGRLKTAEQVLKDGPAVVAEAMLPKLFAEQTRRRSPELVDRIRQVILSADPRGIAAALRGMAERPDATPLLPDIDVPTLVLCGEHDGISPPDEMRAIAAALPNADFAKIPAAGHLAPLENAAAVNAHIRRFTRN